MQTDPPKADAPKLKRRWLQFSLRLLMILSACTSTASAGEIHRLLEDGQIETAKTLIAANAAVMNSVDDEFRTPLHIAAARGQLGMVRFLLEKGAAVNARAHDKFTPLHVTRDPEIVKLLIEYKADIEAKDSSARTALENAAWDCRLQGKGVELPQRKIVRILLDAGADYDIHSAIHLGDFDRARHLLNENPERAKEKRLMQFAAMDGHASIVKLLLDHKADPEDADFWGIPVLYFAVEHPDVVRLLLDAGANPKVILDYHGSGGGPTKEMKWTLLHEAADKGQIETAKLLIEAGVPIDGRTCFGRTPMQTAAVDGQPEMVTFLLKKGANVRGDDGRIAMTLATTGIRPGNDSRQKRDKPRYRAVIETLRDHGVPVDLFAAIALGQAERVKEMLSRKPELANSKSDSGITALERAVELDEPSIVVALFDAGASAAEKNEGGYTMLHNAAYWGCDGVARLLIDRKANVNAIAKDGSAPLHTAAREGNVAIAKLLLAAGADINAKDSQGRTPLSLAQQSEMIQLLVARGATK
jgi:ankyrin repeat protein